MQPLAVAQAVMSSWSQGVGVPEQPVGVPVPVVDEGPVVAAPVVAPELVALVGSPPTPELEVASLDDVAVDEVEAAPAPAPPSPPAPEVAVEPEAPPAPPVPKRSFVVELLHARSGSAPSVQIAIVEGRRRGRVTAWRVLRARKLTRGARRADLRVVGPARGA
jgi:hypothetical protein